MRRRSKRHKIQTSVAAVYTQMYKSLIGDSTLLGTQAITQLQTVTTLEANI
jgi:hypothetical protein